MIDKCSKCSSKNLFIEIKKGKANHIGLYCGDCGLWLKWITKQELQVAKFRGYKVI